MQVKQSGGRGKAGVCRTEWEDWAVCTECSKWRVLPTDHTARLDPEAQFCCTDIAGMSCRRSQQPYKVTTPLASTAERGVVADGGTGVAARCRAVSDTSLVDTFRTHHTCFSPVPPGVVGFCGPRMPSTQVAHPHLQTCKGIRIG